MRVPFLESVIVGMALALDTVAVSIASGAAARGFRWGAALRMALYFGVFQALMPLLGWACGNAFSRFVAGFAHWLAFGLLALVGVKMIIESFAGRGGPEAVCSGEATRSELVLLALATSIDALAVGVSFSFLGAGIAAPAVIIGATTFCMSLAGYLAGCRIGRFCGNKAEIAGGLVLIGIGLKILLEH